jgi:hypothetical protein
MEIKVLRVLQAQPDQQDPKVRREPPPQKVTKGQKERRAQQAPQAQQGRKV